MSSIFEGVGTHLASFVREIGKEHIAKALEQFPSKMPFYTTIDDPDPYQGDVWKEVNCHVVFRQQMSVKPRQILLLSNTCDMTPSNSARLPPMVTYVPLLTLEAMANLLREEKISEPQITNWAQAVRNQEITNLFHLPSFNPERDECVAWLSAAQSIELRSIQDLDASRNRASSLHPAAHWLLLVKLSIHWCRAENADRMNAGAGNG